MRLSGKVIGILTVAAFSFMDVCYPLLLKFIFDLYFLFENMNSCSPLNACSTWGWAGTKLEAEAPVQVLQRGKEPTL